MDDLKLECRFGITCPWYDIRSVCWYSVCLLGQREESRVCKDMMSLFPVGGAGWISGHTDITELIPSSFRVTCDSLLSGHLTWARHPASVDKVQRSVREAQGLEEGWNMVMEPLLQVTFEERGTRGKKTQKMDYMLDYSVVLRGYSAGAL